MKRYMSWLCNNDPNLADVDDPTARGWRTCWVQMPDARNSPNAKAGSPRKLLLNWQQCPNRR
jgi:hypothetical protein